MGLEMLSLHFLTGYQISDTVIVVATISLVHGI